MAAEDASMQSALQQAAALGLTPKAVLLMRPDKQRRPLQHGHSQSASSHQSCAWTPSTVRRPLQTSVSHPRTPFASFHPPLVCITTAQCVSPFVPLLLLVHAVLCNVWIFGLPKGVRGMAAREAVQPGDCLVALPRESALLATPGQRCPFPDWVDAGFWNTSTWCAPHP